MSSRVSPRRAERTRPSPARLCLPPWLLLACLAGCDAGGSAADADAAVETQGDAAALSDSPDAAAAACECSPGVACPADYCAALTADFVVQKPLCTKDSDCGDGQICREGERQDAAGYAPGIACRDRCVADLGCFGPSLKLMGKLISDADQVLFLEAAHEAFGFGAVPSPPYTLKSWRLNEAPVTLATLPTTLQAPTLTFATNGFIYGTAEGGQLWRCAQQQGCEIEIVATQVTHAWLTESFLWWSAWVDGVHQLWRMARAGGAAIKIKQGAPTAYEMGSERFVLYRSDAVTVPSKTVRESLLDDARLTLTQTCGAWLYMDDYAAYCSESSVCRLCRFADLETDEQRDYEPFTLAETKRELVPGHDDGWLYFQTLQRQRTYSASFIRIQKTTGDVQPVASGDTWPGASGAAVADSFVWWDAMTRRMVVKPLPALQ